MSNSSEQEMISALRAELIETLIETKNLYSASSSMAEALKEISNGSGRASVIAGATLIRVREVLK